MLRFASLLSILLCPLALGADDKAEPDVKPVAQRPQEVPGQPGIVPVHDEVVSDTTPKRVGRVIVEGNEVTRFRVILNQINLRSGQILEYPELDAARMRLIRLGIFDNETSPPVVRVIPNEWDSAFQDILVQVKETRTGQFMVGGSVNTDIGLTGNVTINERNFDILRFPTSWDDIIEGRAFRGGGEEFKIEAAPGVAFSRYSATFREPALFDTPFGLMVSGYYSQLEFPDDAYIEDRLGMRFTLYRRLDPYWQASLTTRIEDVGVTDVPVGAPEAIAGDAGYHFLLGIRAAVTRDTRDSIIYPTSGNLFNAGIEQVFGPEQFPIGTAEFTQFLPFFAREDGSGQQVLCLRTMVELEGGNAPVYERFYGGGIRSFRGFQFRGVGPIEDTYPIGGNFAWLNTIEYQVPLLANGKVQGVIFCDHGTVEENFAIHNYRVSIGTGIRVSIPWLGPLPLALDLGIPVNQAPQDKKQLFTFSIGVFGGSGNGF